MIAQAIIADPEKCQACRICVLQCAVDKSKGKTLLAAIQEGVMPRIKVIGNAYAIPNICRHCESVCVSNCPSTAIERTAEGVVRINEEKCIKCLLCLSVCPFKVIRVVEEAVTKCDLCYDRLLKGKMPACVESCPISALKFEKPEIVTERKFVLAERFEIPPLRYDVKVRAKETPKQIFDRIKNIQGLARLFKVTAAVKKKREEFKLPPIPPEAVEDLKKIISVTELARKVAEVKTWTRED